MMPASANEEGVGRTLGMNTTLVINRKGGAGKTTVATNLASYFASERVPTTILDYDPQGSSLNWLKLRTSQLGTIHGANGAPERFGTSRGVAMYVPPETQQLIIDAPAGATGVPLQQMLRRANSILIPVTPSSIDVHATANFIKDLLLTGIIRACHIRIAVVANRVRRSMPVYAPLERFLHALNLNLVGRLLDSDAFVKAAETGVGIFEDGGFSTAECKQFAPIADWVCGRSARADQPSAPPNVHPLRVTMRSTYTGVPY
jgi:chromosome partitioning protein